MKQKPGETPDQWVRQTLSQLPDAPPPGSSFDAERLWVQLRPELQIISPRRRIGLAWRVAAACLTGLMVGWFWWHQSTDNRTEVVSNESKHKVDAPIITQAPNLAHNIVRSKPAVDDKERPIAALQTHNDRSERLRVESIPSIAEPIEVVAPTPELLTVAELPPVLEKRPELRKLNLAVSTPKRRFNVVHENELRAEEESRPKLYRTENFVRIGTGERTESTSDENRPALTLPLAHKPNQ